MTTKQYCSKFLPAVVLCVAFNATGFADDATDVVVVSTRGEVQLTVRGETRAAQKDKAIELPAKLRTGAASSVELRQGPTTVSAAADTQLEIPATATRGEPIERVIQPRGNAFYSVGKREKKKFRVETPYLVAVVKGTQFNVAVQSDGATISLFEGRLEVRAADGSDVVDLKPGEIAIRHASDTRIRVLRMDTGEPVGESAEDQTTVGGNSGGGTPGRGRADPGTDVDVALVHSGGTGMPISSGETDPSSVSVNQLSLGSMANAGAGVGAHVDLGNGSVDAGANVGVDAAGVSANVDLDTAANLGSGTVDMAVDAGLAVGGATADIGVESSVDLGAVSVSVGADASVDLGGNVSVDAGVDASVDLGGGSVDVSADAGIDLGGSASVEVGADVGVDLGSGSADASVDAGLDLGGAGADIGVDAGVDAGVDLGAGTVDLGADTSLDLGGTTPDVGVDAGVDLGSGDVGVDASVGGIDVGLDIDLGEGTIDLDLGGGAGDAGSGDSASGGSTGGGGGGGGLLDGLKGLLGGK